MQLVTLGGLHLDGSDFTRPKPLLLLSYLAIEGRASRRILADLFFSDVKDPRDSLSTAVRQLAQCDPELLAVDAGWLASDIGCDAVDLIEALDAGLLDRALEQYRGSFMAGIDLELGEELEEWVFTTREYLAARVRDAWIRQAEAAAFRGNPSLACRNAEAAMDLMDAPPLQADVYPRLYAILKQGRSPQAERLKAAAADFGIDIETASESLVDPLGFQPDSVRSSPNNLPVPSTTFVGRDPERMEIANLLATPQARVITVHGAGGMGKSRLAIRVARDQVLEGSFPDGVFLIELEALSSVEQIADAIAASLGMELGSSGDPFYPVIGYLGDKRLLLVLDGFEHLIEGASRVSELAMSCPYLKVVVTSRARLNITEEYVLALQGLPVPSDDAQATDAHHTDAVQLLIQRAKKTRVDFELRAEDRDVAIAICRLVSGSPLAIELAMAWIHAMPLADIRAEIEADVGFLEARSRNALERHRNLRVVFDRSWRLLSASAQDVLPRLSVFRGGFRREAASAVAGATLPALVQLTDASLITVRPDGRYGLHALVHQFCFELLESQEHSYADTLDAHAEYFREYSDRVLGMMYDDGEADALVMLNAELANVLGAWQRTFDARRDRSLAFPGELVVFFDRMGLLREGMRFFRTAEHKLDPSDRRDVAWLREIWANQAWLEYRNGNFAESERLADKAVGVGKPHDRASMIARNTLGLICHEADRLQEARSHFQSAIEIAQKRGELLRAATYHVNLAIVAYAFGSLAEAKRILASTIDTATENDYPYLQVNAWNNLGALLEEEGDYRAAVELYSKALEVAERTGYQRMRCLLLTNLAEAELESGDIAAASRGLATAEASVIEGRDDLVAALVEDIRGRIHAEMGNADEAEKAYRRGLEKSVVHPQDKRHLKILVHLAELWASQGRFVKASWVLEKVLPRMNRNPALRDQAEHLIASMPEPDDATGGEHGTAEWLPTKVLEDLMGGR